MQKQVVVFITVIAAAIVLAFLVITSGMSPLMVLFGLLALGAIVTFFPRWEFVRDYERLVMFRLGRFIGVKGPGWIFYIPNVDSMERVDLRTQTIDIAPQSVITNENVTLKVDAIVYYRVVDPQKVVIEIKDHVAAVRSLIHAQIRNVIGKMDLEEVITKTEEINQDLYHTLQDVSERWGIKTVKVEIQSIQLPEDLIKALHQRRAAREYKAKVQTEAEAKQDAIDILDRAASKMSDNTLAYLYLNTLQRISDGKSNKIIFPMELSQLASMLSGKLGGGKSDKPDYEGAVKTLMDAYTEKQKQAIDEKVPPGEEKGQKLGKKAEQAAEEALEEIQVELDADVAQLAESEMKKQKRVEKAKRDKKQKKL
ncbi:MAG: SPFH domain-containing protein [Candidatus Micrarchaeota archaeon]